MIVNDSSFDKNFLFDNIDDGFVDFLNSNFDLFGIFFIALHLFVISRAIFALLLLGNFTKLIKF